MTTFRLESITATSVDHFVVALRPNVGPDHAVVRFQMQVTHSGGIAVVWGEEFAQAFGPTQRAPIFEAVLRFDAAVRCEETAT